MVGFYPRGLEFLPSLSLQSGFGLKLKVASSKIGLKFSFYLRLNSYYSCWKLYWQAYMYNLWYFLSRCLAELETLVNKSFCSWLKAFFCWGREECGTQRHHDFNFLKFTEAWFVIQDVVCPRECPICTWEENVFWILMENPEDIN